MPPFHPPASSFQLHDLLNCLLKAAISNPNTGEKAKANAKEQLEKLGGEDAFMKNNGKGE